MTAVPMDGKALAAKVRADVARDVAALGHVGLATVLVGDDPASHVYIAAKQKAATEAGIDARDVRLPADTSEEDVLALVDRLNHDDEVDGILVQLPLPKGLDELATTDAIDPAKDVDGLTPMSAGYLMSGRPGLRPCTPRGCMRLLEETGVELAGKHAIVIGRSNLVGKPIAQMLLGASCTVTMAHSRTRDLAEHVGRADIVIAAVGRPSLVSGTWLREGAIVIDVGINRRDDGTLCGDVDFDTAKERASWITPVPGGVGPMTIAMLLGNTVDAAFARAKR